jgi:hypothetical protein
MTGGQLKEELARIAEDAPAVHMSDDLFARGRRATMRVRVLAGAVAVACVAAVAAATVPIVTDDRPPLADTGTEAAVPDHIYFPDDGELGLPLSELSDVGPAVATYGSYDDADQIVLVTPDSEYRLVELPGYNGDPDEITPLLSPDGTFIAYPAENRLSNYLALVDLRTGESEQISLAPDLGAIMRSAQWSPDGDWLAWAGQKVGSRTDNGRKYGGGVAGVVHVAAAENRPLPRAAPIDWDGLGVCDDGAALRFLWPAFMLSEPGRDVEEVRTWQRLVSEHGPCAAPEVYAQLDAGGDDQLLGWIPTADQALAVFLRADATDDDPAFNSLRIIDHDGKTTKVGSVAAGISDLSVATGLMSADRPTVPAGESPWAPSWWEEHRSDLFILAVFVAAPCLLFLFVRRRLRK